MRTLPVGGHGRAVTRKAPATSTHVLGRETCAECGGELPPPKPRGRPRKYCAACAVPASRARWRRANRDAYNVRRRELYASEHGPVRPYAREGGTRGAQAPRPTKPRPSVTHTHEDGDGGEEQPALGIHEPARIAAALHEAGHAVVAWRLGCALREVSIEPREDHLGQLLYDSARASGAPPTDLLIPIRGPYRDALEIEMMISLAGRLAEELAGQFVTGYTIHPDAAWAEQAAERLAAQSPRAIELAADDPIYGRQRVSTDEKNALGDASALAGAEAMQHLAWMQAVTRRLVSDTATLIEPLAAALLEQRVLSGKHAEALIAAHLWGASRALA